ncbi:MAG TPA: hypothetical protein VGD37_31100 [Kofleriaceae bacterium]
MVVEALDIEWIGLVDRDRLLDRREHVRLLDKHLEPALDLGLWAQSRRGEGLEQLVDVGETCAPARIVLAHIARLACLVDQPAHHPRIPRQRLTVARSLGSTAQLEATPVNHRAVSEWPIVSKIAVEKRAA